MASYGFLALSAAVSALTYKQIWIDPTTSSFQASVPTILNGCGKIIPIFSFKENNFVQILRELICIRLSFNRLLFSQTVGYGSFFIFASIFVPFFVRLSYHAASPNNRSFLQGPILPSLALLLTSVDVLLVGSGIALFIPTLIALLYTFGAPSKNGKSASLPRLPCAAQAIYGANITAIFLACFYIGTYMYDEEISDTQFWWEQFVPIQFLQFRTVFESIDASLSNFFPIFILPILFLGYNYVQRIKNEEDAKKQLDYYRASEVAYGFERTWAYYRQTGLVSFISYLFGLSKLVQGLVRSRESPNPATQYILWVTLQLIIASLTMIMVDIQSAPEDGLKEEATKAIQRAPAGNPGVEDNVVALTILAFLTGPSMSFMLWHAHKEEIQGWKGRRAWRLNSSSQAK